MRLSWAWTQAAEMQLVLLEGDINVPRTTSGALALIPETSIFSEWPVLFLSMGGTGEGSETQKEVSLVVFRAGHC